MMERRHLPLVMFTSLAIAGGGLVAADAVLMLAGQPMYVPAVVTGGILEALALGVSLSHLGRKARAPLAVCGAGRSALSNEIICAGLAVAATAALVALAARGPVPAAARVAAGLLNAAFLAAIGLVYLIRGQATWGGAAALTPLTGGCAFGAVLIQMMAVSGGVLRGVVFLVGTDAAVFLLRWQEAGTVERTGARPDESFLAWRHQWFAARFFLLDVVPFFLLFFWPTPASIGVAAAGLIVDRAAFYALGVPHTTEGEVARVDEALAAIDDGTTPPEW